MTKLAEAKKAIAAVLGLAAVGLSAGLIPSPESTWLTAIIALASAVGVYAVPNKKKTAATNGNVKPPQYRA